MSTHKLIGRSLLIALFLAGFSLFAVGQRNAASPELWWQVEVIRTAYGVPHIRAQNFKAAGYALAWVQCEDYGTSTPNSLLSGSGRRAAVEGREFLEADLNTHYYRQKVLANYEKLSRDVRDVYEGFAAGVNRYIELNRGRFPATMPADFTGRDVLATEMIRPSAAKVRNFVNRLTGAATPGAQASPTPTPGGAEGPEPHPDDGSNAWAFAPSRTKSGKAILLRNPHLNWNAGYYEAHMTVPGKIDFYGDFRIGGPFGVIGGFNRYLGFSTTNNSPDLEEFYVLDADRTRPDHYFLDGKSHLLARETISAGFRNGDKIENATRDFWSTPFGPVVHRTADKIYIVKFANDGEYRNGEQFLRMMRARSLAEYKAALKMRARPTSNFTYADVRGNIHFIWNASLPLLPHPVGEDLVAKPAKKTTDLWSSYVPFEDLPEFLNPPGGYIHNENNSPHFTNVERGVNILNKYGNFEEPELSLRGQLGLQLVRGTQKYTLEDVMRLKHNYRALLADRVKSDLITLLKDSKPDSEVSSAIALLESWDNTTSPASRGSTLFEIWWAHYSGIRPPERTTLLPANRRFATVWNPWRPFDTPAGLADPAQAVESFKWAIADTKRRFGRFDVTWGDVHRVRRGNVDVPVGGCSNEMGCFRVMGFMRSPDGKLAANSGDGWVIGVEFGVVPKAYSVLSYGQSIDPASPWHSDQAEMFARGEVKKVAFTQADIDRAAIKRFRPGAPAN